MNPMNEPGELLRGRMGESRERFDGAVTSARSRIDDKIQEHPMRALLIALGTGVVVGLVLRLGKRGRSQN
jgi:ElaB/YqjD/DUF883 family membrane-anchored ribosome-binding protein